MKKVHEVNGPCTLQPQ